jgi:hypothetical protein
MMISGDIYSALADAFVSTWTNAGFFVSFVEVSFVGFLPGTDFFTFASGFSVLLLISVAFFPAVFLSEEALLVDGLSTGVLSADFETTFFSFMSDLSCLTDLSCLSATGFTVLFSVLTASSGLFVCPEAGLLLLARGLLVCDFFSGVGATLPFTSGFAGAAG